MSPQRHRTRSPRETEAVGASLAQTLRGGDVVLLQGDLGAGKTTFVRGACRALGAEGPITSPTFTIGQRYPGPTRLAHIDLYRVGSLADEDPELLADYIRSDTIAFVEWPDGAEGELVALGRIAARVRIEHRGADEREIEIA